MRRSLLLVLLATLIAFVPASRATARWMGQPGISQDNYVVGDVATTTQWFLAGKLRGAGPLDGRLYHAYLHAYLLPPSVTEGGFGTITPPRVPASTDLGTLEISGPFERPH